MAHGLSRSRPRSRIEGALFYPRWRERLRGASRDMQTQDADAACVFRAIDARSERGALVLACIFGQPGWQTGHMYCWSLLVVVLEDKQGPTGLYVASCGCWKWIESRASVTTRCRRLQVDALLLRCAATGEEPSASGGGME